MVSTNIEKAYSIETISDQGIVRFVSHPIDWSNMSVMQGEADEMDKCTKYCGMEREVMFTQVEFALNRDIPNESAAVVYDSVK